MTTQRSSVAGRSRRALLRTAGAAGLAGIAGCLSGDAPVRVLHAGSLAPPFEQIAANFEAATGRRVERESWGSVAALRRVVDQDVPADVLAVADFRLLRDRLLPGHGTWYAVFATNAMAIQRRPGAPGPATGNDGNGGGDPDGSPAAGSEGSPAGAESKASSDAGSDGSRADVGSGGSTAGGHRSSGDWWRPLAREGVAVGHADPAVDPGGYRAVTALKLGAVPFDGRRDYDRATAQQLRDRAAVTTDNEIALGNQLRAGKLDYAVTYRSLCRAAELPWFGLPDRVNLGRTTDEYARHYARVAVGTDTGTYRGAPIAYGLTVPAGAARPDAGARFVDRVLGPDRSVLSAAGLEPTRPVAPADASLPDRLTDRVRSRRRIGPLEL